MMTAPFETLPRNRHGVPETLLQSMQVIMSLIVVLLLLILV